MKSFLFSSIFLLNFYFALAQNQDKMVKRCGTEAPPEAWDKWFNQKVEEFKLANPDYKTKAANYVVPVVFHIIHGGQNEGTFPNVSMAQINSQMPILNNDFAGTGLNVGNFANTNFSQSLISNCNISFCLAEKDPSGNTLPQKGIHRINYNSNGWANPTSFTSSNGFQTFINNTVKPATIWDPARYLNIWISDVNTNVGLLGYATFPAGTSLAGFSPGTMGTATTDGVWCWSAAIGNVGSLSAPYDKGRTLTHEVGHWVGLRHIWGDGNCATDFCNDTPTQQGANTGCPSYPNITCSNGPNGDMFMNFMDYCEDACLYMFTPDQRTRIQTAMANGQFRSQLTASSASLCGGSNPIVCSDTISNFSNIDTLNAYRRGTASATDAFCPQGFGKAGYIAGTNCWGDIEKAEFISSSKYLNVSNPVVTGVIVLFFQYGNFGTDGNSNVSLNIYSGTNANTQPDLLLGSTSANLANIAASTNTSGVSYCGNPALAFSIPLIMPYKFNFSTPVPVPTSGGFFASVGIPNVPGDTVCILDKHTGSSNTAWERWSNGTWHDFKSVWDSNRNFNLAILPVLACGPVGVKETNERINGLSLFPNPGEGKIHILSTVELNESTKIKVYDLFGKLIYSGVMAGENKLIYEIDLSQEDSGVFLICAENTSGRKTFKYILQKN